jgi:adenylate cyclase
VVAIDEKAVQRFGRWPWSRDRFAQGITALHQAGAAAVGLDVMFVDEDRSDASAVWKKAQAMLAQASARDPSLATPLAPVQASLQAEASRSGDAALEAALAASPEVVQVVLSADAATNKSDDPSERARRDAWASSVAPFVTTSVPAQLPGASGNVTRPLPLSTPLAFPTGTAMAPLERFVRHAKHLAQIAAVQDADGVTRAVPLFAQFAKPAGLLPSLGLQTAAVALGATVQPIYDPEIQMITGARLVRDGKVLRTVPLSGNDYAARLDYPGPSARFTTYSFADVVDGVVPASALKGKAVLVGVILLGEYDQIVTPLEHLTAGVYSHATLLSNVLSGHSLTRGWSFTWLEVLFLFASAVLYGLWFPRLQMGMKLAVVVVVVGGWFLAAQLAFNQGHVLATLLPCVGSALSAQAVFLVGYFTTDREKGRLKGAFSHYLSGPVMEHVLAHPEDLALGGQKKELTVLFSDIRGFTTLAERMAPEALVKFINSYLTPMTEIVLDEAGTLDKYIGDAVMAFWGAPVDQEDHALRACRTALRFVEKMASLRATWRAQGLPEFDIGVGINSGPMIVGNMGSDVRFDYTVMGDAVNLGSRLEGTNKDYGTRLMISEATFEAAKGQITARRLGAVRVKGKRKPVRIYELRGLGAPFGPQAEAIARFEAAVDLFGAQKFDEAGEGFLATLAAWPDDGPSLRYLEEIVVLKQRPPGPGWDGVYAWMTK